MKLAGDNKIPGVQGNYLFFQELPRALEEKFKIQEFSRNSRSNEHHAIRSRSLTVNMAQYLHKVFFVFFPRVARLSEWIVHLCNW